MPSTLPNKNDIKESYLLLFESELIRADNWDEKRHKYFHKIFTWKDDIINNKKYFKFNFAQEILKNINKDLSKKEKLCTLIAGNKKNNHLLELYSEREKAIKSFEKFHLNDFDLYGIGWDKFSSSNKYIDYILDTLASYGEVIIKNAYGDFKHDRLKNWDDKLHKYSLVPIYQKPYSNTKNGSDIKIAVDITKTICDNTNIDIIALVTSDSDFTPLIIEAKTKVQIIGFGENKTNDILKHTYSEFITLANFHNTTNLINNTLIQKLENAIKSTKKDKEYSYVSEIGKYLKDRYSDNAKNYGYNSWGDIFKELEKKFTIDYIAKNGRSDTMIVSNLDKAIL